MAAALSGGSPGTPDVPRRESSVPGVVLGPGLLAGLLLGAAVAAFVSLHVFAVFGVVAGAELVALGLLGSLSLLPRLGWGTLEQRLLVGTAAAAASVAAATGLGLPLGLLAATGQLALAPTLILAVALAAAVALSSQGWLFDSALFPAAASWPSSTEALELAERRSPPWPTLGLLVGVGGGNLAGAWFGAPLVGAFGLAFLGNSFGLAVLGVGLVVRPSLPFLLRADLDALLVPHGLLIGAGLAALLQAGFSGLGLVLRPPPPNGPRQAVPTESDLAGAMRRARSALVGQGPAARRLLLGLTLTMCAYALVAAAALAASGLDELQLAAIVTLGLLAAFLTLVFQLFAGLAASRAGWVPVLGGSMAGLAVVLRLGWEPAVGLIVICLLAPAGAMFAELGYQLRAAYRVGSSWLRGQQVVAALLGLGVALAVVTSGYRAYAEQGFVPPVAVALAAFLELASRQGGLTSVAPWILAGALAQWLGGNGRQVGVLLGTGLLLDLPLAGWALLAGLALRALLDWIARGRLDAWLALLGFGCVIGEMIRTVAGG